MNRRIVLSAGALAVSVLLAGCENSFDHMPDLSDKEAAVIEEYAAGLILARSDANRRLATVEEITYYDERETVRKKAFGITESRPQEEPAEIQVAEEIPEEIDSVTETAPESEPVQSFSGIADFCNVSGFNINYKGHSVASSYPDSSNAEDPTAMFFALDAEPGSKLLILQFEAENTSVEEKELDLMGSGVRYRITINDGDSKGALTTMLLDDLSSFKGMVAPGETQSLVLIREIAESISVDSIELTLRNGQDTTTTRLE